MREPRKDKQRLEHIIAAIERIERYVKDKTFKDLLSDDMMFYAVVKNIEMMGEAANMLTLEFQNTHTETPWKMVKGMRNYIVHEYFQIDNVVVWDVVTKELKPLREQIEKYLTEINWEQWEVKQNQIKHKCLWVSTLTINVRESPKYGTDVYFSISKGQFNGGIDGGKVLVKFDGGNIETYYYTTANDRSMDVIFLSGKKSQFIAKLKEAKSIKVQTGFFQEGDRTFTFTTPSGLVWEH